MRWPPCFSRFSRRNVLTAGVFLTLALACQYPAIEIQEVVQARSCTDDALTMEFRMQSSAPILNVGFLGGSANVLGIAYVYGGGGTFNVQVVSDLDTVALGEAVELQFEAQVVLNTALTISLSDIQFYRETSDQLPITPDCTATTAPSFTLFNEPALGLSLQVMNAGATPMTLVMLDLAAAPGLLPSPALHWDDPQFNALPWQPAVPGGTVLDPGSPAVVIDLPDAVTGSTAALCRFISIYEGQEVRGILQADLTGKPLRAKETTWGGIKALYRN